MEILNEEILRLAREDSVDLAEKLYKLCYRASKKMNIEGSELSVALIASAHLMALLLHTTGEDIDRKMALYSRLGSIVSDSVFTWHNEQGEKGGIQRRDQEGS